MIKRAIPIALMFLSGALAAQSYEPPRTASGKPNLQGFWTNASLTTMQRSANYEEVGLVIPDDRLPEFTNDHHQNVRQATDDNQVQGELPDGSDLARGRGYNAFGWTRLPVRTRKGQSRTSWITYPEDGRIPFSGRVTTCAAPPTPEEVMMVRRVGLGERCIIGFGSTGGPPMNNVLYNNMYQFVQTDDYLMILVEMVHDTRIIPINGQHRPDVLEPWLVTPSDTGMATRWWLRQ